MPDKRYKNRYCMVYFSSPQEKTAWDEAAIACGVSLSAFILSMAERGKAKKEPKAQQPSSRDQDLELKKLREELRTKSRLIDRYETELWTLKHSEFLEGDNFRGSRMGSAELSKLLKEGGTWPGHEIMEALNIDPTNIQATKILMEQLKSLEGFGLITETARGWKWIK